MPEGCFSSWVPKHHLRKKIMLGGPRAPVAAAADRHRLWEEEQVIGRTRGNEGSGPSACLFVHFRHLPLPPQSHMEFLVSRALGQKDRDPRLLWGPDCLPQSSLSCSSHLFADPEHCNVRFPYSGVFPVPHHYSRNIKACKALLPPWSHLTYRWGWC